MMAAPNTAFKKGEKRPNQGRPKGVLNKNNQAIRDMIAAALEQVGGVDYLAERANDPKTASAFLSLIGKVMPIQVTGENGDAIQTVTRIELVPMRGNGE
jgi:hypothetical protein